MKEQDEKMENKILDCAERLFLKKGYALTSMTEIAKEVGCNQALVHYYFRTKDNLFQKIFAEKVAIFFSAFIGSDQFEGTFLERLQRNLEQHFDMMAANRNLPFMMLNEMVTNPKQLESVKDKLFDTGSKIFIDFEKDVQKEVKAGRIRPTSAIDITIDIVGLIAGQFLILPILEGVDLVNEGNIQEFLQYRKQQIIETIINGLRR